MECGSCYTMLDMYKKNRCCTKKMVVVAWIIQRYGMVAWYAPSIIDPNSHSTPLFKAIHSFRIETYSSCWILYMASTIFFRLVSLFALKSTCVRHNVVWLKLRWIKTYLWYYLAILHDTSSRSFTAGVPVYKPSFHALHTSCAENINRIFVLCMSCVPAVVIVHVPAVAIIHVLVVVLSSISTRS